MAADLNVTERVIRLEGGEGPRYGFRGGHCRVQCAPAAPQSAPPASFLYTRFHTLPENNRLSRFPVLQPKTLRHDPVTI